MMNEKKNPKYLRWLGTQECIICGGSSSVVGHHPTGSHLRGMGSKAPDNMAYPLCFWHHKIRHESGWRTVWKIHEIDPDKEDSIGNKYFKKFNLQRK